MRCLSATSGVLEPICLAGGQSDLVFKSAGELTRQRGPNTVHYKPYVEYVFEVGGREYQSKAISSSGHVKFSREKAANVLKRFEKGSEVEVKYDPNAPHDSYLIAGVGPGVWAGVVFGISLIVLGVLGIVNGW